MNKEPAILELVRALSLDAKGWQVVDHWEADRCAIGIAADDNPRRLVYVSCFGTHAGRFNYECEAPEGPEATHYRIERSGEGVELPELVRVLKQHLA